MHLHSASPMWGKVHIVDLTAVLPYQAALHCNFIQRASAIILSNYHGYSLSHAIMSGKTHLLQHGRHWECFRICRVLGTIMMGMMS